MAFKNGHFTNGTGIQKTLTTAARDALVNPADGLTIYNTDNQRLETYSEQLGMWTPQASYHPVMTDWQSFTMTPTATTTAPTKGTVVIDEAKYRRVGDSMEITWQYHQSSAGTAGNGTYLFPIPAGLVIDTTKLTPSTGGYLTKVGTGHMAITTDAAGGAAGTRTAHIRAYNSTHLMITSQISDHIYTVNSGHFAFTNNPLIINFSATVPIQGWSTAVATSETRTFKISNFLASGTRVTTTPSTLGEYRALNKNNASTNLSDTAPTTAPSITDGLRIHAVSGSGAAGAGLVNRYIIFIGQNKHYRVEYYASAGKTGYLDPMHYYNSGTTTDVGLIEAYDPTTGLLMVSLPLSNGSDTRYVGLSSTADANGPVAVDNCYFDVIVSDTALPVQIEAPNSEVHVYEANGHGSTNTKVRRFSSIGKNVGTDVTYTDSATDGASFTINSDGIYAINYSDRASGSNFTIGISKNSSQLTTNINAINDADKMDITFGASGYHFRCATTLRLEAGDVIRPHTDGTPDANVAGYPSMFRITKVSN